MTSSQEQEQDQDQDQDHEQEQIDDPVVRDAKQRGFINRRILPVASRRFRFEKTGNLREGSWGEGCAANFSSPIHHLRDLPVEVCGIR